MKARYEGVCRKCGLSYPAGTDIKKLDRPHYGWGHVTCPSSQEEAQEQADAVVASERKERERVARVKGEMIELPHPYDAAFVAAVKMVEGRRFDRETKSWWIPAGSYNDAIVILGEEFNPAYAKSMAEGRQFARAREAARAAEEKVEASRKASSDIEVPVPEGLAYLPYQLAGIAFALGLASVLIGDEMGLGKTIQALGVVNADPKAHKVLVICPASLRLNWLREAQKWLVREWGFFVVEGKKAPFPRKLAKRSFVIVNYDLLKKYSSEIHAHVWDVLICDESHYLKNAKAQRTVEVIGKWDRDESKVRHPIQAKRRVYLTGTPIPNRPIELWSTVKALDPQGLGRSWKRFAERYCAAEKTRWGWDTAGASNLDELQRRMRGAFMVRRLKADVLTELPTKSRQLIVMPANGATKAVNAEKRAVKDAEEQELRLRVAAALAKASSNDTAYNDAVAALQAHQQACFEEMSRLRHETALAKVPYVAEHVRNVAESVGQVVVFAHHRDVVRALRAALETPSKKDVEPLSCVEIIGDTPMAKRQEAVDTFQAGEADVFIGNIRAAGVGLTLTRAANVIFAELDWVPGNVTQAEDRCHRIGQTRPVTVQHLVLEDSLDETIAQTLLEKQAVQDAALDNQGEAVELPSYDGEYVDDGFTVQLYEDVARSATQRVKASEKKAEKAAAEKAKRAEVLEVARTLSDEQVEAIHACLQALESVCDGAREKDGAGFNAVDTRVGSHLARKDSLTYEEAALGRTIIGTYNRQLRSYNAPLTLALSKGQEAKDEA